MRGGMAKGYDFFFFFFVDYGIEDSCVEGWLRVKTFFFSWTKARKIHEWRDGKGFGLFFFFMDLGIDD